MVLTTRLTRLGTHSSGLVVSDDDGRVPLGGALGAVHLRPVADDHGRRADQDLLTGLHLGPAHHRLAHPLLQLAQQVAL